MKRHFERRAAQRGKSIRAKVKARRRGEVTPLARGENMLRKIQALFMVAGMMLAGEAAFWL